MKCAPSVIVLFFLWICDARYIPGCRDVNIWIGDGSVDCKYLYTPSFWGLHNLQSYYCTSYPLTNCCVTCTKLGYVKGKQSSQSNTVQSTAKPKVKTTMPTTTNPVMKKLVPLGEQPPGCRDEHVWIAGGSVECKYLFTPSFWGLHTKPKYYCTKYPLTKCCFTCTELGYMTGKKSSQSNTVQSTAKATVETTMATTTNPGMEKLVPVEIQPPGADTYVVTVHPLTQP